MNNNTKEEVYDKEIHPLMNEIIKICNKERIPIVCSFSLDEDLLCTTSITDESQVDFDDEETKIRYQRVRHILLYGTGPEVALRIKNI